MAYEEILERAKKEIELHAIKDELISFYTAQNEVSKKLIEAQMELIALKDAAFIELKEENKNHRSSLKKCYDLITKGDGDAVVFGVALSRFVQRELESALGIDKEQEN